MTWRTEGGFIRPAKLIALTAMGFFMFSKPAQATNLNPAFTFVGTTTINASWTSVASNLYTLELSTNSGFVPLVRSSLTNVNFFNFTNLTSNTTHWFRVKIDTESAGSYVTISTRTQIITLKIWDGGGSTNNASEGANWLGDVAPINGNSVLFDNTNPGKNCNWNLGGAVQLADFTMDSSFGASTTVTISSDVTVMGNLLLASGILSQGSRMMTIGGDWTKTGGTYSAGTSTVTFIKTGVAHLSGGATFYGLKYLISGSTLQFNAGSTTTVMNSLNFLGVGLMSNASGVRWNIRFIGSTTTLNNVRVQDSNASAGAILNVTGNSFDFGNNVNWNFSNTATLLNPFFNFVSSSSFITNWAASSGNNFNAQISTTSGFSPIMQSTTTNSNSHTFNGLLDFTTYYFRVKIATEPAASFSSNFISTRTLGVGGNTPTFLNPYFTVVDSQTITATWNLAPSSYTYALADNSSFTNVVSSGLVNLSTKTFNGLASCTTYYFHVKLTSETDPSYGSFIAAQTLCTGTDGAMSFNLNGPSDDQMVSVPHNSAYDAQGDFTLEFWFRRFSAGTPSTDQQIITKGDNSTVGWTVILQTDRTIRFRAPTKGGVTSLNTIDDTAWHHIAVTRNSSNNMRIFIDGMMDQSGTMPAPVTASYPLRFGNADNQSKDFEGELDEIRFWNIDRIAADINCTKKLPLVGNEAGLVTYWNMNETSGQTVLATGSLALNGVLGSTNSVEAIDPSRVAASIPNFGSACDTNQPLGAILNPVHSTTTVISQLAMISGTAQDNESGLKHVKVIIRRISDMRYWDQMALVWNPAYMENATSGSLSNWSMNASSITWQAGEYYLETRITDNDLNVRTLISTFNVTQELETTPPTISFLSPIAFSTYTESQLTYINGTANDNVALSSVSVSFKRLSDGKYWDNASVQWNAAIMKFIANGLYNWNFTMPISAWQQPGQYEIYATAFDQSGNQATSTTTFAVASSTGSGYDFVYPTVYIQHPANGTTHNPSALSALNGTANDNNGYVETMVSVQDLMTGYYWTGTSFSTFAETFFNQGSAFNWTFGGITNANWMDGHTYRLIARTRDSSYNITYATSDFTVSTSFNGDTIPPYIAINTPLDGTSYSASVLTINGNSNDDIGVTNVQVSIRNNSTGLYYDGSAFASFAQTFLQASGIGSWSYFLPYITLQNGSYLLQARALDAAGNISSQQVSFSITGASGGVDSTYPDAVITFPTNNETFTSASQLTTLSGTCSDNGSVFEARVYMRDDNNKYYDGNSWTATIPIYQYVQTTFNWFTTVPAAAWKNGSFTLTFECRDNANNITSTSTFFSISGLNGGGTADTVPPQITVYNPYQNAMQNPYSYTQYSGRASDAFGIAQVTLNLRKGTSIYYDGTAGFYSTTKVVLYPQLTNSSGSVDWTYNVGSYIYTNGSYILEVEARDQSGNVSTQTVNFSVYGAGSNAGDINPPTVAITSFANNTSTTAYAMASISGTANDDVAMDKVEVEVVRTSDGYWWSGTSWQPSVYKLSVSGLSNWSINFPVGMWDVGTYVVKARARDMSAKETLATNNLTISGAGTGGTPPQVAISCITANQTYVPSNLTVFFGTVTFGSTVRVRITDGNLNTNWDPTRALWVPEMAWSNATVSSNTWLTNGTPTYWPNGRFYISAEAINGGLIGTTEKEFLVQAYTGASDFTPPSGITLTALPGPNVGSVQLSWAAPGDDGTSGTANGYTIKYSITPMATEADWTLANDIVSYPTNQFPPTPLGSGTNQSVIVGNLPTGVAYFWAIRASDENFNRGPMSNNPLAVAFSGCAAGVGDGEGSMVLSRSTMPIMTDTIIVATFTVGAHGITNGGKIFVRVPDGWAYPQIHTPSNSGYFTAATSNGLVTFTRETEGQMMRLVVNGTLNASDEVYVTFKARSYSCTLASNVQIKTMSQANSCGIPAEISSQPTLNLVGGSAAWIGFDGYEKFAQIGSTVALTIRGQDNCSNVAAVGTNVTIEASAVVWSTVTYTYISDSQALLSTHSIFSPTFATGNIILPNGQSSMNLFYKLNANDGRDHRVRIRYTDFITSNYTSENTVNIIPVASAQGISNATIDKGTAGSATTVTFSPPTETVYINYNAAANLPSTVKIMKSGVLVHQIWANGTPVRVAWNGDRTIPNYGTASAGLYNFVIEAAGQQNTSLSATLQTVGINGVAVNSSSVAIANVNVNLYGTITRYTQSDSSGTFSFQGVPNGQYTLRLDKSGYQPREIPVSFTGSNVNLSSVSLTGLSKIVVNLTRSNTLSDLWGSVRTADSTTSQEFWTSAHFGYGRAVADNGYSTDKPEFLLRHGVPYTVRLEMPGFTATPLNKTLSDGETYTWDVSLTAKKGVTGTITLGNGIVNTTGLWVYVNAIRGSDTYPTKFVSAYIAAGEFQTSYSLLDMDAGSYTINFDAQGLSRETASVTMSTSDVTQNITLTRGGEATIHISFAGDTTGLDMRDGITDGRFPVTLRYSDNQTSGSETVYLSTHATLSTLAKNVSGVRNASYSIFYDRIDGFSLTTPSPQTLVVAAGTGTLNSSFTQDSGVIHGTVTFAPGGGMGTSSFYLFREATYRTTPIINGNQFEFRNLASGRYSLSIYESVTGTSKFMDVFVTNGRTTEAPINLNAVRTFSVSGTVRTVAAPPYDFLTSISSQGAPAVFYTVTGTVPAQAVRVHARLINTDGSVDALPITSAVLLDPTKLKFADVNLNTGAYQIDGLEEGKRYRLELNTDLNNDGKSDIPRNDFTISPSTNIGGMDFTVRDGGKIQLAITSPNSEAGYALRLELQDTDRKLTIQSSSISLMGTTANVEFPNLQTGRYLISITDNNSPVKYAAKPVFAALDNISDVKSLSITLSEAGRVQLTLANRFGTLITSDNESLLMPAGYKVKVISRTQTILAALDSSDGKFKTAIIPGTEYTVSIEPPVETSESDKGKIFQPSQLRASISKAGEVLDLGVVVLKAGDDVSGTVVDENSQPIARVPVLAYQSLAKNIAPLQTFTNDAGKFTFNLSQTVRFYDFVVNPVGGVNSNAGWTEEKATSIDITKSPLPAISITLKAVTGGLKGRAIPSTGQSLLIGYGDRSGQPGASVLVTINGENKTREFVTDPDGRFDIPLPGGRTCTLEILAASHSPKQMKAVTIPTTGSNDLGDLTLAASGYALSGKLTMADGTLPLITDVSKLIAIDNLSKSIYRAQLNKVLVSATENVESYVFYGLPSSTLFDIKAVGADGKISTLKRNHETPAQNSILDLTFTVAPPELKASFISKDPQANQITAQFHCSQAFLNSPDDLDLDGTADSNEFDNFVTVRAGAGSLAFGSVTSDRKRSSYIYTLGSESLNSSLVLEANFKTDTVNPKTGNPFVSSGTFSHPFGLAAQRTEFVGEDGAEVALTDGSSVNFPAGAFSRNDDSDDGILVKMAAADTVGGAQADLSLSAATKNATGTGVMALAKKFGPKAYPAEMYRAIKALESTPASNPFSSFYDIFLPAGVSHVFNNGSKPTLTLKYDEDADPTAINIYYYNETHGVYTIENVDRRIDTANRTISVTIGHASIFTVLASSAAIIHGGSYTGELEVFNFPNPFNLKAKSVTLQNPGSVSAAQTIVGTMIKVNVPVGMTGSSKIEIFNMAGELVRTINPTLTAGESNYVHWDGTNDHAEDVASGVYIGYLTIGGEKRFFKMAVLK